MYEVKATGEKFLFYLAAVKSAHSLGSEVIEVATGNIRWFPAPKPTAKRLREYRERLAAYKAQESLK